jgi:putative component of toxin-antitoxin plasmid stabilization module
MLAIRQTETFSVWLRELRDLRAKRRILVRIDRLAAATPAMQRQLAKA